MSECIVRLEDAGVSYHLIWSSVVDAPISPAMSRAELEGWIRDRLGTGGLRALPARMARVDHKGTSLLDDEDVDQFLTFNRAGLDRTRLTKEQIVDCYVRGNPRQRGEPMDEET